MDEREHPDAVNLVRAALWGTRDDEARRAAEHADACPACTGQRDVLRRVRDVVRLAGPGPSASTEQAVRQTLASPAGFELDLSWLVATSVGTLAGVRSADDGGRMLRCEDGDLRLDAFLQPTGEPGRFSVSGQVLVDGREPGVDLEVTLFLDRRPAGAARTDGFGEFVLDASGARGSSPSARLGVRVAGRGRPRHVELWRPEGRQ
jgi:hypothetical protein